MNDSNRDYIEWKGWREEDFGRFTPVEDASYRAEVFERMGRPGGRILEIGFGNGSFMGSARSHGFEVVGIEANDVLIQRALASGIKAFKEISDLPRDLRFDAIVLFDVLEHIAETEIPPLLRSLFELLEADGKLIARFPNGDSPFGRIVQHGDATHVTTLGRRKVSQLAAKTGFKVEYLGNPAAPLRGVGWKRAAGRAIRRLITSTVERLVSVLYFYGERVSLDQNYTLVLRKR